MEETNTTTEETDFENNSPEAIAEADKEKFLKSMLTDQPYEETISLLDGQLNVTFKTMTVEENGDVVEQITLDKENSIAENSDAYFITISTYRLAQCLVATDDKPYSSISKKDFIPALEDKTNTYVSARAKAMQQWPTFKLSAFLAAFNIFEAKVIALTKAVQQQNFWKASA
jgi:hypothetical protein